MLSIALSFYLIGNTIKLPAINVPFSLFAVGVFLGIIRKPYNYYLYFLTIIAAIPDMITEYGKMLLTLDGEISATMAGMLLVAKTTVTNSTIQATQPWWTPIGFIVLIAIVGFLVMDTVKALIKNARLYLIISSYPLLAISSNIIFTWVYLTWSLPSLVQQLSVSNMTPEALVSIVTPVYRNMIIFERVILDLVCVFLAPLYAYYVAKELKIYKRLGIEPSKPTKPKKPRKQTSNDIVIDMLRSTIIKSADDREY
jgi:hypothetical protein